MQSDPHPPVTRHPLTEEDDGDGYGHDWEDENNVNYWLGEDMDEGARTGCVEGSIAPGMVDGFIHGEDNRHLE
jgi:hypothetical protein